MQRSPFLKPVPSQSGARDLLTVPGLLSLSRLPLAACFPFVVDRPAAALAVLTAAAVTDVLDGWWARRFDRVTALGAALDPLTDKVFTITVGGSLLFAGVLPVEALLLLGLREIGEALLVVRCALGSASCREHARSLSANAAGKVATVVQFVAVCSAVTGSRFTPAWVGAAAVSGALAAVLYWRRAIPSAPAPRGHPRFPGRDPGSLRVGLSRPAVSAGPAAIPAGAGATPAPTTA